MRSSDWSHTSLQKASPHDDWPIIAIYSSDSVHGLNFKMKKKKIRLIMRIAPSKYNYFILFYLKIWTSFEMLIWNKGSATSSIPFWFMGWFFFIIPKWCQLLRLWFETSRNFNLEKYEVIMVAPLLIQG